MAFLIATLCARFELSDSLLTETFVVNRLVNSQAERLAEARGTRSAISPLGPMIRRTVSPHCSFLHMD